MRRAVGAFVAVSVFVAFPSHAAGPLEIHGTLIAEYRDSEFGEGLSANGSFRIPQGTLSLQYRFSEAAEVFARTTYSDRTNVTVQEGWLALSGIGPGRITLGRFFRPRGAPIPTLNVSIPSRVFRSAPVLGLKYSGEIEEAQVYYEIGVTNRNRLSLGGTTLGDTFAIARVATLGSDAEPAEVYLHLRSGAGGAWGTVEVGVTGTYGRLSRNDLATLQGAGLFFLSPNDRTRRIGEVSVDYLYGPFRAFGDAVFADEGDLDHQAWEAGLTYRFLRDFVASASYGEYRVNADVVAFSRPWTWNRNVKRLGLIWEAAPGIQLQAEYDWNGENAQRPGVGEIENDEVAAQVVVLF